MGVSENGYNYKLEDTEWYKNKGCEEVKICAGKGDLIREYCVSYGSADRSLTSYFLPVSMGFKDHPLERFAHGRPNPLCNLRMLLPS